VDGKTGVRSVISDFNDRSEGPGTGTHASLMGVAVGRGQIFVTDGYAGLFIVDPHTGHRRFIPFYDGSITGQFSPGLAVDTSGRVLGNLQIAPAGNTNSWYDSTVVRVVPQTDKRAVVTDLPSTSCCQINDLALEQATAAHAEDAIFITTAPHPSGTGISAIYRVNTVTGDRSRVSNLSDATQGVVIDLSCAIGLAVEHSGSVLANSGGCLPGNRNLLVRIDPKNGHRTIASDFDNSARGPVGQYLSGVGVQHSGQIIVGAYNPKTLAYSLYRVDPGTGQRMLFSDFANPKQGPKLASTNYLAVVPHDAGFCSPPPAGAYVTPFGATH
ncbi:MAG: hypothetical protein ACTHKH_04600, partial [Trinickia sp.]